MYINDRQQLSGACKCLNGKLLEIKEVRHSSKFA